MSCVWSKGSNAESDSILNVSVQSIGTVTPDKSALLELRSSTKGFLPSRMKWSEIIQIEQPAEGLIVYNIDTKKLAIFNGSAWTDVDGSPALKIEDSLDGGIVFYIDGTGEHGLLCAQNDISSGSMWGCTGTSIAAAGNTEVGTGGQNTLYIIEACLTNGIAARLCSDYVIDEYDDWFLPTLGELTLLFSNLFMNDIGDFSTGAIYWSSSEIANTSAWAFRFDKITGGSVENLKDFTRRVRPVRSF